MLKREDFIFVTNKLWMSLPEEFRSRYINVDSHRTFLPPAGVLQAIASGIFTPYQPRKKSIFDLPTGRADPTQLICEHMRANAG
ncbi:MAG: hypothetical protein DMG90_17855 [Acidobacteria bacterium]|nr:MAG: hypothetical protein DMG90_17855 [Acidobacteriota bacterium]